MGNTKGVINKPISRKKDSIIEREINKNGQPSITEYEVLKELKIDNKDISIVKCNLKTGRTHQIRVHFSYIRHPLLGDDLYKGNKDLIKRQALHCTLLSFIHPITKNIVTYSAPLPNDFKNLIINNTKKIGL